MSGKMQFDRAEKRKKGSTVLPFGLFQTRIEILDDNLLTVEGCVAVLDYSENYVCLKCKNREVHIYGADLNITTYEAESITLTGRFQQFELNEMEG